MTEPAQLRLFFALWPDAPTRRALVRATRSVVRAAGGRAVPAANLHLTLAFLGGVPRAELERLKELAAGVSAAPFELVLARTGYFRRARSLWLGPAETSPPLAALEQALWDMLVAGGWPRDSRPFVPHLTLVRKAQAGAATTSVKPVCWPVNRFSLIQSVTEKSGAVYQELASWPLNGA